MIRIVMAAIFLVFLCLLILGIYYFIKKEKEESINPFDKSKYQEDDEDINRVYNSAINFDNISIKDRHYLINFIDEINPDLPKMQRLDKDTVDITSYLFNKKYGKKDD